MEPFTVDYMETEYNKLRTKLALANVKFDDMGVVPGCKWVKPDLVTGSTTVYRLKHYSKI